MLAIITAALIGATTFGAITCDVQGYNPSQCMDNLSIEYVYPESGKVIDKL